MVVRIRPFRAGNLLVLSLLVLVIAWFLWLRPVSLGGPASYVMVSGHSMEPTLYTGDLAVVRKQGNYNVGDIVAFRVGQPGEEAIVIHRIAGVTAEGGFLMQGDNKRYPDPWHPFEEEIVGKMWFSLPGGARFANHLRAPAALAALAGGVAAALVLTGGRGRKRQPALDPSGAAERVSQDR